MNTVKKKVAFHTLGCKLNFAETSTISRSFPEDKFERVSPASKADIYVINTCSVTDAADRKCRQAIKKFITMSPGAFIAVVGCYAQLKPQDISAIPGVDLVLGTNEKFDIAAYMGDQVKRSETVVRSFGLSASDAFNTSYSLGDRTRSFLKVQDGCDYGCSYCTIPMARGSSRNPHIDEVIREAEKIAGQGIREVVLTGVNIGDFGRSTGESFGLLLGKLLCVEGIERYRISSIEPNLLTDEIINMASGNDRILPHFHIPLQSGCNKILGLMRRRYTRELFLDRVSMIRTAMPYAGIGADVIVGFPGESHADFLETYSFLKGLPLSYLHVFPFSERPGTIAEKLPDKVSPTAKAERSKSLIELSDSKSDDFNNLNKGQTSMVLFENSRSEGMITGFSSNYIRVEHPWYSKLAGQVKKVKLNGVSSSGRMTVEIID